MMWQNTNSGDGPSPEQLAAYADGELDAAAREWVEAWLADHSEAAGEVEAIQRLARLFPAAAPSPPRESAWHNVFQRICAGLPQPAHAVGDLTRRRRRWAWSLAVGAAAAVLLALTWLPLWRGRVTPDKTEQTPPDEQVRLEEPAEPYPVASGHDVEIVSIEDADLSGLVVGEPPVHGPLRLASADDVWLESVDPAPDGMVPYVRMGEPSPMIVAPLDAPQNVEESKP